MGWARQVPVGKGSRPGEGQGKVQKTLPEGSRKDHGRTGSVWTGVRAVGGLGGSAGSWLTLGFYPMGRGAPCS